MHETTLSNNTSSEKLLFGQPVGLFVLFLTEMWERFSYYGMRAILFLYMIAGIEKGGMGLKDKEAGAIYGIYTASVYLLSLPGGWLADNVFGQKKAIYYGGLIIILGHLILTIPGNPIIFYLGLCVVSIGTGALKPNISSIVGELYPEGGVRRDAAFSIFYMGINLGGAFGMIAVGYLGEKVSWHMGFGAAAIGMVVGMIVFRLLGKKYLEPYGLLKAKEITAGVEEKPKNRFVPIILTFTLIALITSLHFSKVINLNTASGLAEGMGVIIVSIATFYFIYILIAGNLTVEEKKRVAVMIVFFLAVSLFWAGYEQGGSSLNTFSLRYTNRDLFGVKDFIPASWLQSLQSIFVICLAPVMAIVWIYLAKKGKNPSAPVKFGSGLLTLSVGFLIMYFASERVLQFGKVSPGWLASTYLFCVLGELCVSPVGLSFYTKLAPKRFVSQLMGIWFVGNSLGNLIAGLIGGKFDADSVNQMPGMFMMVVYFSAGVGLLILIFSKPIKNWMGGVE